MATSGSLTALYQNCSVFYSQHQLGATQQLELVQKICMQTAQLATKTPFLLLSQLSLTPATGLVASKIFIKQAALLLIGYWDQFRNAESEAPVNANFLPMPVQSLLYPYRNPTVI